MAKKQLTTEGHPKQHLVNVVMTNKKTFQILTTYGKEGDTLTLDLDPNNHPAWHENSHGTVNNNSARVARFNKKFGDFKI